jgi:hypothetical protein
MEIGELWIEIGAAAFEFDPFSSVIGPIRFDRQQSRMDFDVGRMKLHAAAIEFGAGRMEFDRF